MGYWSTIDKNQKQIESNTSRINQLTEKLNELEKQERALTKIAELNADDIQDLQQYNADRKAEDLNMPGEDYSYEKEVEDAKASQDVIDAVLSDCFQDLQVLCSSKTRTIKDSSNARFVNVNNVIDIINKYSNSNKGRI